MTDEIKAIINTRFTVSTPWLVSIFVALLFNAGVVYSQFLELKTSVTELKQDIRVLDDRVRNVEIL
mgnify:CR=1 FL=1